MTAQVTVALDRWRTRLALVVRGAGPIHEAPLRAALTAEVDRLERLASRFRDDSVVGAVNRAGGRPVSVPWSFVEVLTASLDAAAATDGLVTPLVGEQVDAAGYRGWRAGEPVVAHEPGPVADWRDITITPAGTVGADLRIPPTAQLDLGAVAKAWLADRMARLVTAHTGLDVIADMGGDLAIHTGGEPWQVAVDPGAGGARHQLLVGDGGLATSGTGKRCWRATDGTLGHHVVDPRTGRPASGPWRAVSVWAADARGANTAATAALVLGAEAPAWLTERGLAARLTGSSGETLVGAWPAPDDAMTAPPAPADPSTPADQKAGQPTDHPTEHPTEHPTDKEVAA